jgi:hypothetical protein
MRFMTGNQTPCGRQWFQSDLKELTVRLSSGRSPCSSKQSCNVQSSERNLGGGASPGASNGIELMAGASTQLQNASGYRNETF